MKDLENFKKDINNCSRCGLCQSVCPIFRLTKNDCTSPKGKFTMLNNLLNSDEKPSKTLKKYLNTCLNCKKCFDFCPSKLDIVKINASFNKKYSKIYLPKIKNLEKFLFIFSFFIKIHRFLKIDNIVFKNKKIFYHIGFLGKYILLFNTIIHKKIKEKPLKKLSNPKYKVLFFQGCMNKYINPSPKNALLQVLNKNNVEVEVGDFTCCGRLYYLLGKEKEYNKIAEKNKNIINKSKYDYIIFDCATCFDTVLNYENIDNSKMMMVEDFLDLLELNIENSKTITYFKPCLLKNYPNVLKKNNYKKIKNDKDICCGMSFPFNIFNKKLSNNLSEKMADEILKINTNCVLTSCSLCKIGLNKEFINKKSDKEILSMVEFFLQ